MFLVKILFLVAPVLAYPTGAPLSACGDMFPTGHKTDAQNSTAPYTLTVGTSTYDTSGSAQYTVQLTSGPNVDFEGFFIQARRADCESADQDKPVGTFVPGSANYTNIACGGLNDSAITHKVKYHYKTVSFIWKAGTVNAGSIYFRATVVQHEDTFWTNVNTGFVKVSGGAANPTENICTPRIALGAATTPQMMFGTTLLMTLVSLCFM